MSDVTDFPLKAPDKLCNHRLARGAGYCKNESGQGTDHRGWGRCKSHENGADGDSVELFKMLGLGDMIAVAEMMSQDDQEYAYHVSNNFLVLQRAKCIRQMDGVHVSSREKKELIDTIAKIDAVLRSHPLDVRDDGALTEEDEGEMGRLLNIEDRTKKAI